MENIPKELQVLKALQAEQIFSDCKDCKQSKYSRIASRANILSKYIIYIFFNFGRGFLWFFSFVISKRPSFLLQKNFELIFAALYFYVFELKKCASDF